MITKIYSLNTLSNYKYVVVLSYINGKKLLSRHKNRTTWETQGGHIEKGETPLEAAKRELYEESGAVEYKIVPYFDYRVESSPYKGANGMVFLANITKLRSIPEYSEMAEVRKFDDLPDNLTYPYITPVLFSKR